MTTVLPGAQSLERAWFYGMRLMAHYLDLSKKVVVQVLSVRAWEGWMKSKHREVFHDLSNLVTHDQRSRIQPMSLTLKQINEMPRGPFTVQARMKDATKAAKEVAMSIRPEGLEEELKVTDQRYQKIAPLAIQRIKHLFEDKGHFLHEAKETGKQNRAQARAATSQLFLDIGNHHQEQGHVWQTKGTGLQCGGCSKRITKHWKIADLEAVKNEKCPAVEEPQQKGGNPQGLSKGETIQQMLTGALPEMSAHRFELQKNYLVCMECKCRILRHAAKEKLVALAATSCWNEPWMGVEGWEGHSTHVMWRQGGRLSYQQCKAQALSKAGMFKASKQLRSPRGEVGRQSTLPTCFRAKTAEGCA